jgi:predicted dehydrogenase
VVAAVSDAAALTGVVAGAGYFSQFHFEAWARIPQVRIAAVCDPDPERAAAMATRFGVATVYTEVDAMLAAERPDFLDIVTPPSTHLELVKAAGRHGAHVLCQKPLAPSFAEAVALVEAAEAAGVRLMVHENFRFQPWHGELHRLIAEGAVGRLFSIHARTRMGDGWGEDAYMARQPYFRTMPRLLVFETGVHFIDLFRYLGGEIVEVYAKLRRLNPAIAGEDCALVVFTFESGAVGVWDASRYSETLSADPRLTFGEFLIEGDKGALRLDEEGALLVDPLGQPPRPHAYTFEKRGFAGDCVHRTLRHFIERLTDAQPFTTDGRDYLRTLTVQEAIYASAASGAPAKVSYETD